MRVLIVSGIWPPDVGGPASHAPDVAAYLLRRGHDVEVVTTADAPPAARPIPSARCPVITGWARATIAAPRSSTIARASADVVYTTGMFGRSALGASLARRPYVVKLTADPAFERSRRRGLTEGNVDEFQRSRGGGAPVALLRFARDVELRHAAHVFTPSAYLRELALGLGCRRRAASACCPIPAPAVPALPPREELRAGLGLNGATIAFAGRLTAQKSLERALEAVARLGRRAFPDRG